MGEEKKAFSVREIDEGSDDQKGAQSMGIDKAALSENFASEGNFDAEYSAGGGENFSGENVAIEGNEDTAPQSDKNSALDAKNSASKNSAHAGVKNLSDDQARAVSAKMRAQKKSKKAKKSSGRNSTSVNSENSAGANSTNSNLKGTANSTSKNSTNKNSAGTANSTNKNSAKAANLTKFKNANSASALNSTNGINSDNSKSFTAENSQNSKNQAAGALPARRRIFGFIKNYEFSKHILLMILFAFAFSVAFRMWWVHWASGFPNYFFWDGELMINTNDGYAFAEGARDRLAGFHQPNDLSYFSAPLSIVTAFLAEILPFKIETIFVYLPALFSSLIVVPILLISSEFRCMRAGFIGALVASVANSYYNRTMAGYYDTDMLNIVLAMCILWALIRICTRGSRSTLFWLGAFVIFYMWWYPSSFSLNSMMLAMFFAYTLIFKRKSRVNYEAMIIFLIALCSTPLVAKILISLTLFWLFAFKGKLLNFKSLALLGGFAVAFFIANGGLSPIIFQAKFYIFRSFADNADTAFHFFNVNQTIQESGIVPTKVFMERISSHVAVFVIAAIGYVVLCFRHKEFLLSIPLLLLGFAANKAGLRFTIYAVGVMGLSFGYILYFCVKRLDLPKIAGRAILLILTALAIYPAWQHIVSYKVDTVFYQSEVRVLDELKDKAQREDYALSWWDYGYGIRYYSDVKTLIDGGKHLGNDNFPVSFALFKDQMSSANMARLDVEYTERGYSEKIPNKLKQILKDYNATDVNDFILSLGLADFKPPKPTRDIYYILPDRMMNIFPVVTQFSNIDITDGKQLGELFFITSDRFVQDQSGVHMDNGFSISPSLLNLEYSGRKFAINTFYETSYDANGKLSVKEFNMDSSAQFYVIFMRDYGRFLLLDKTMLNSSYIQLFVFERYRPELFEPVILSPAVKVYKLKR